MGAHRYSSTRLNLRARYKCFVNLWPDAESLIGAQILRIAGYSRPFEAVLCGQIWLQTFTHVSQAHLIQHT